MPNFGCYYCSGMGYEDYPTNKMACRISEHVTWAAHNVELILASMDAARKPYTTGTCPYCKAAGLPVGVDCIHWTGLGWLKAGNSSKRALFVREL